MQSTKTSLFIPLLLSLFLLIPSLGYGELKNEKKWTQEGKVPILLYHRFGPVAVNGMTVTTNVFGTRNVITAAETYGVGHVVIASTGKALRPYTPDVYCASKRVVEWLAARAAAHSQTRYSAARFTHVVDNSIVHARLLYWREGDVVRLDRRTGAEEWRQKSLAHRGVSAPAVVGDTVVVGDYEGVIHWLDPSDGHFLARAKTGGRISSAPQALSDDRVLVFDDGGGLHVFRTTRK